jgi:cobalt-zinc-cadmium efflux system membrane fusion protein
MKLQSWMLTLSFAALFGCGSGPKEQAAQAAAPAPQQSQPQQPPSDPMEIKAEPALLKRLTISSAADSDVATSIQVAARIEVDDRRVNRIGSPLMGRIAALSVQEGQEVKKGQSIAQLNSTGLSGAQLEFLKAISEKQLAQRAVERAQRLLKADVIGAAELQRREAELVQATASLDASHHQLLLLGMPLEAVNELQSTRVLNPVSGVLATLDGTVMNRKVTIGQMVQPADTIVEIADLSSVWLVADVPEQNAGALTVGQQVTAEIAALPGRKLHGTLTFVSSTVNPETRTVRARMDVPNPDRRLKPAMLCTMEIRNQKTRQMLVPLAAVVRESDQDYVFVQLAADVFALREVKVGTEYGQRIAIVEGLRSDQKIVTDGAFHLNNERRRRSVSGAAGGAE